MSKIVKGIGKAVKGIIRGVRKFFKSKFGKLLLAGAAIYLAGGAAGWWNTPFSSVNGAFLGASPVAAEAATATAAGDLAAAGSTLVDSAGAAVGAGTGGAVAADTAAALNAAPAAIETATVPAAAAVESPLFSGGAVEKATLGVGGGGTAAPAAAAKSGGILNNLFSSDLAKYGAITVGGNMLAGAFSPNELDMAEKQAELERKNLAWRQKFLAPNFEVGNIPIPKPTGNMLPPGATPAVPPGYAVDANGNVVPVQQPGIINTAMK